MPTLPFSDEGAAQLFDEGARLLESHWDDAVAMVRYAEHPSHHDARGTLAYAIVLLRKGDKALAERAIRAVLALQEKREQDAHYGNFRWTLEEAVISDLNGVEFVLDSLNYILRYHAADLSPELEHDVRDAVALGLDEIDRLDVHPSYTNIALSDICNSIIGGETLAAGYYIERGTRRLDEWLEFTGRSGAPHEFNSPTYLAVDIQRLAFLAEYTADPALALKARVAEERLWLHVAAHYHPQLAQLAGPHSRSYFDGWSGADGYLKLILWRLLGDDALRRPTPYALRTREEGEIGIALGTYHCPGYVLDMLRTTTYPYASQETTDAAAGLDITTYMTGSYALGTASRAYAVGDPPEPWPGFNSVLLHFRRDAPPGYGTLFARYLSGDRGLSGQGAGATSEDLWDEGQFVAAQHHNRAIVAYGLRPRTRPAPSFRLSLRMLGVDGDAEIWAGDRRIDSLPARCDAGDPIVIAAGVAYLAIIALEPSDMGAGAPIELHRSEGTLVLDIYNYLGPAKSFWEHRSQSGPFYKGNVRNAFILEVGDASEFADLAAFRNHVASAQVADGIDGDLVREIAYASPGSSLSLRYSLLDMRVIERKHDRETYAAPMGRAGSLNARGPQWLQTRDSLIELGRARVVAGSGPKWLFAGDDARRYVFVKAASVETPLWIETPATVIDCDAFPFGRVVLDEAAGEIQIEAVGEMAPLRIRSSVPMRLSLNGTDVTDAMTQLADGMREFGGL
ncbi:MAG: hypothetical protein M3P30_06205 [Chloroflexota bacterium]|nr:hypothetical protein [Chloroflexota bacterium]